jgi:hypothetical protein
MGTASATPDTHLQSGAQISVSISGFPANATVAGVQCDQRVVTTQDQGYCNSKNPLFLTTDASGKATGTFTVASGPAFASTNGKGVCDALHSCYIALTTLSSQPATVAVATLAFGSPSKIRISAPRTANAGSPLRLTVRVGTPGAGNGVTGTVTVRQGSHRLAMMRLASSGKLVFHLKLEPGRHKLGISYSGDANSLPSSASVTVKVKARR